MKYKTEWNLGLLYKNEKDPQIEKDMKAIESACAKFEKKYKSKNFISSSNKLLKSLEDRESMSEVMNGNKCWWYFALRTDLNSNDSKAGALATKMDQRISNATNKIKFFFSKWPRYQNRIRKNSYKIQYCNHIAIHLREYSVELNII